MSALRILLADDHTLFRHGLRKIIQDQPDWQVVDEASDGRDAVQKALALAPDVVVVDVTMPQLNGIEVTRQIVKRLSDAKVLVVSMHSDEAYVVQAVEAGARGYLLKDAADVELVQAIAAVASGRSYFSPTVAALMLDDYRRYLTGKGVLDRYETLTEREREVLQLVAEGRTNKDVADRLEISPTTVETHRANILRKLEIHSTAELVLYAVRRGVIR